MCFEHYTSDFNSLAVQLHELTSPELIALSIILDQLMQLPPDQLPPYEIVRTAFIRLTAFFTRLAIGLVPGAEVHHAN